MQRHRGSRAVALRVGGAALACSAAAVGIVIATHHPLWPQMATAAWLLWVITTVRWPGVWLIALPASLPLMNLSPWTGWLAFDEFDLVITGALAGGYAAAATTMAVTADAPAARNPGTPAVTEAAWLAWPIGLLSLHALWRGLSEAGAAGFDWFDGYSDALNSLRVFKGPLYALLLLPLLRRQLRESRHTALRCVCMGMLMGLAIVTLAAIWEREAYPGLWDFSQPYRTTALFWEMHVGGAAIDAYLALAWPFAAFALWSAQTAGRWSAAALLALLTEYACLTTFSRGVYLAAAAAMAMLLVLLHSQRPEQPSARWRAPASTLLGVALLVEAAAIVGGGTFMADRTASTLQDFSSRVEHWQNGLGLLHGADDWLLGKGLGRLPEQYARTIAQHPFSGDVRAGYSDRHFVRVAGPDHGAGLAGLHALTQRIALTDGVFSVAFDVRVDKPATTTFSVCELHLLYERNCQKAQARIDAMNGQWQHMALHLAGPSLSRGPWFAPRMGVFSVTVDMPGASEMLTGLVLQTAGHPQLLHNADFSEGLARWFPSARHYFLPWHIDNLYLEWLIERGVFGLAAFLALVGAAMRCLLSGGASDTRVAPFLAASLCGTLVVGLVSSVMDVPRVAFLFLLLVFVSLQIAQIDPTTDHPAPSP